jgi:pyruvate-formate lyase
MNLKRQAGYAGRRAAKKAEKRWSLHARRLLKMADSCDRIIENPARNLWEGFRHILYQY